MAKSIPTAWNDGALNAGNLTLGEQVLSTDWETILEQQNYVYAHRGSRSHGLRFDTAFTTTSGAYTHTNSTPDGRNLDTWFGLIDPIRPVESGGSAAISIDLRTFSRRCAVRCTVYRMDTGATLTTLTATNSLSTSVWTSTTANVTLTTVPLGLEIEVSATSGTAELWAFSINEDVITSTSLLPTG
jgi:hypothetical protein